MNIKASKTARVGRPKSTQKREAILHAAACLFLDVGYKSTSMDGIAAAAGVSKQTVYSHFETKEALLRACVYGKVKQYRLAANDMPYGEQLPAALRLIGRQVLNLLNDPDVIGMHRLLASECIAHPSLAQAFFETGPEPTLSAITDFLLANDIPSGRFGDGRHAAEVFFVLIQHKDMMERVLNFAGPMSEQERDDHVGRVVDQFLRIYS